MYGFCRQEGEEENPRRSLKALATFPSTGLETRCHGGARRPRPQAGQPWGLRRRAHAALAGRRVGAGTDGLQLPAHTAAGGTLHLLSGAAPGAWVLIIPLCGTPRLQPVNEAEE